MEAENARPLTEQEIADAGFGFSDPAWEIAWQLKDLSDSMHTVRWQLVCLNEQIPRLKNEIAEALRILGQTIERATAPWYVRIFWRWRAKQQAKQMDVWKAEMEKREEERRLKVAEIMKKGNAMQTSRFAGRY